MDDYSHRFKKGLIENGIKNVKDYYYCGGTEGTDKRHKNYFKLVFGDKTYPPHKSECICGHEIKQNCYISKKTNNQFDFNTIVVLGNCCIKRFEIDGRTCENCGDKHKNRKTNYCNDCKERCIYCGNKKNKKKSEAVCDNCRFKCEKCDKRLNYDGLCNPCYYENIMEKCKMCKKGIKEIYEGFCWSCYKIYKINLCNERQQNICLKSVPTSF